MDFDEKLQALSDRVKGLSDIIENEEMTKTLSFSRFFKLSDTTLSTHKKYFQNSPLI